MKVLITGSNGFVGGNLIKHFANKKHFEFSTVNTRLPISSSDFMGVDVLIHLAGKAHDFKKASNDQEYFTINTDLTIKLFDLFLESSAKDFIYFSSVKAVTDTVNDTLTEDFRANPVGPYGISKLKAEQYLLSKDLPEGKRLFVLRPCMIHGPGNKGNLNLLFRVVKTGIPYPLAGFKNVRSFLSIENLNFMIEGILSDKAIAGGIYNLADDVPVSTNDVIRVISKTMGLKPKLWKVNTSLIRGLSKVGDVLHLPLNSDRLMKLTQSYVVSNQKIKKALNISNLPVSSLDGLKTTIESFRSS